jgi:hypothetical protein
MADRLERLRNISVKLSWGERQSFGCGCGVEAAVPGGEDEVVLGEHAGGGEVQGVHAAQFAGDREFGGVFDQALVHFDHAERGPLLAHGRRSCRACAEADGANGLHEADTAHEPALGLVHDLVDSVAAGLGDIALDQRARVEVEIQRSDSRSASTNPDALRSLFTGCGARVGSARVGATSRP